MPRRIRRGVVAALIGLGAATPASAACDRACLTGVADAVLASIVAHDAARLPLAADYAATENLVPSVPAMMTVWRTVTGVTARRYTIDTSGQQLFFAASVREGAVPALLYGRVAVTDGRIGELELFINRSRGEGGFMFDPEGIGHLPAAWTRPPDQARRASRDTLLAAGRSLFDPGLTPPPADPACTIVETGRVAELSAEMQAAVTHSQQTAAPAGAAGKAMQKIACEIVAHRPPDPEARVAVIDEVQGEVVVLATVRGIVSSHLMSAAPESNFLPDSYYGRYRALQDAQRARLAPGTPVVRPVRTSAAVVEIARLAGGRIAGFQRHIHLTPEGTVSPWRAAR